MKVSRNERDVTAARCGVRRDNAGAYGAPSCVRCCGDRFARESPRRPQFALRTLFCTGAYRSGRPHV